MNLTPSHLKIFRQYFCLTQKQAAALVCITRIDWWHMEAGISPITPQTAKRLARWTARLKADLKRRDKRCHKCRRNIEKAKEKGANACPYCSAPTRRRMKDRVAEILPATKL